MCAMILYLHGVGSESAVTADIGQSAENDVTDHCEFRSREMPRRKMTADASPRRLFDRQRIRQRIEY
jgi:hypothetical protein